MTATANTSLIMNFGAGNVANPSAGSRAAPKSDDSPRMLFEAALNTHLQARQPAAVTPVATSAPASSAPASNVPARTADPAPPGGNVAKSPQSTPTKAATPKQPATNNNKQTDNKTQDAPDASQDGDSTAQVATDGDAGTVKTAKDGKLKDVALKDDDKVDGAAVTAAPTTFYDVLKAQGLLGAPPANAAPGVPNDDTVMIAAQGGGGPGNLAQIEQGLQAMVDGKDDATTAKAASKTADSGVLADEAQTATGKAAPKTIQEVIDAAKARADAAKPRPLTAAEQATPFTAVAARAADAAAAAVPNTAKTFAELINQQVAKQDSSQAQQAIQLMSPPRMADTAKVASSTAESDKSLFAVHVPVSAEGWDRAIGQKVVMMVSNQRQEVEMQLNPAHLGPIDVKLSMKDGEASLSFSSNHAQVRDALQASMPKLSEMMAENGIQLTNADVYSGTSQQQQQQGGGTSEQKSWRNPSGKSDKADDVVAAAAAPRRQVWAGNLPGNLNFFV